MKLHHIDKDVNPNSVLHVTHLKGKDDFNNIQDRRCTYEVTLWHVTLTTVAVENSIAYSECVFVALVI
jgi:hypothetical protein